MQSWGIAREISPNLEPQVPMDQTMNETSSQSKVFKKKKKQQMYEPMPIGIAIEISIFPKPDIR